MSGHSKWSTIKRKKGAADAKRGKIFTKLIKEISIAVKEGGSDDIESNPRLRLAVQNAKAANMPKDNIERAIKKASGADAETYMELTFEGYGPGGIAIFVECLSDNNNRTVGNVRAIFKKHNGNLGTNGSLSFLFDRKGIFTIPKPEGFNMEDFELEMIDAGAEAIEDNETFVTVTTEMEDFGNMSTKLEELNLEPESQKLERIPNNTTALDVESAQKVMRLVDALEDDDDVQNVYHNLEMTEELEAALS